MSFILDLLLHDVGIYVDESVYQMVDCHDKKDEEGFKKAFEDYKYYSQRYRVGKRMREHGFEDWDWKKAADIGTLCDYDWELFGEEMIKEGVDKDAYDKKWKVSRKTIAPSSKLGDH